MGHLFFAPSQNTQFIKANTQHKNLQKSRKLTPKKIFKFLLAF